MSTARTAMQCARKIKLFVTILLEWFAQKKITNLQYKTAR